MKNRTQAKFKEGQLTVTTFGNGVITGVMKRGDSFSYEVQGQDSLIAEEAIEKVFGEIKPRTAAKKKSPAAKKAKKETTPAS